MIILLYTMTKRITLPWADKFRELIREEPYTSDVASKFLDYCKKCEYDINKAFKKSAGGQ